MPSYIPILTYHSVDESNSVISISLEKFQSQMKILKDKQFNVISLSQFLTCLHSNCSLPKKTAIITFDDGFRNFYTKAYPVLIQNGFGATVFLVPSYIGKKSKWNEAFKGMPVSEMLGWSDIRQMAGNGIDFGAHSMTHQNLTKLPLEKARSEIIDSKLILQKHLNREIGIFCYPYGKTTHDVKSIVKTEFLGACGTSLEFASFDSDIYELPRIDMYYFSQNCFFRYIGTPLFSFYIGIRQVLRSIKNRAGSFN